MARSDRGRALRVAGGLGRLLRADVGRSRGDGGIPGRRAGWRCTITGVRAYVGVTDDNWYRFLADRPGVTEVNFWQPSGAREFRVLAPGEPFFFKTHYPHNKLVGGGFFSDSARTIRPPAERDGSHPGAVRSVPVDRTFAVPTARSSRHTADSTPTWLLV